jgi:glucan-binding YG repeat protein
MHLATQRPQFNGFYYNLTICPSSKSSAKSPSRRQACSFAKLNGGRVAKEWVQLVLESIFLQDQVVFTCWVVFTQSWFYISKAKMMGEKVKWNQ